jgi:long-chain acyl-CoA synthetase
MSGNPVIAASATVTPWPAASLAQIQARLTASGERFEMEEVVIDGRSTRSWKNATPTFLELLATARTHGEVEFILYEEERVTYDAFHRATARLAHWLQDRGVGKGDRVAVAMVNLPEWPVAAFAAAALGAIIVPLNAWWTGRELSYGLRDSGTKALLTDAERLTRIKPHLAELTDLETVVVSRAKEEVQDAVALDDIIGPASSWTTLPELDLPSVEIAPDDPVTLFYTSGTTGEPKGALGSHRNALSNPLSTAYSAQRSALRRGEPPPEPKARRALMVIPLFHVTAFNANLLGTMLAGSTLVFMRKWDVVEAFGLIEREKINAAGGVPTIAWQLLEHPDRGRFDLSSLESIGYGGAPAAPELVRRIKSEFNAMPNSGWGMTETSATITHHGAEDYLNRPDSCGPPVPVADLKIMAEDGTTELAQGEVGELWARGPQIVKGYWNKPEATAATFVDGWVRTGDMARLDEEGFCYIVDRAKDMIIRGGENIYSSEVENVLYEHPAVTDVAVVGIPSRILGEEPAAVVHLAPGATASEAELQAWVKARLAIFKTPVRVLFSGDTLPRNANGKILKAQLRALFEAAP